MSIFDEKWESEETIQKEPMFEFNWVDAGIMGAFIVWAIAILFVVL